MRVYAIRFGVLLAAILASACVSDTLSSVDTQPQPQALAETQSQNPRLNPAARAQAVSEIRQKAAQPGSGQLTNAFADPDGPNVAMTPEQQAQSLRELEANARQNAGNVSDAELAEKQRSIRTLQNEAQTHYDKAVNSIQN